MTTPVSKITKTVAIAATALIGFSATPAFAGTNGLSIDPAALETEAGVVQVHEMLTSTAKTACEGRRAGTKMHDRKLVETCTDRLTAKLVEKVGDARLISYHAER